MRYNAALDRYEIWHEDVLVAWAGGELTDNERDLWYRFTIRRYLRAIDEAEARREPPSP